MTDYKSAFRALSADMGAIMEMLDIREYTGVDEILKAITELKLAERSRQEGAAPQGEQPE